MTKSRLIYFMALILATTIGCQRRDEVMKSDTWLLKLKGYETSHPGILYLPQLFDEISGIVYYAKDSSIIALNDEEGILYQVYIYDNKAVKEWPFSTASDFEELVKYDSFYYAMQSDGSITRYKQDRHGASLKTFKSPTNAKLREFESMVYDTSRKRLLLTCKDCEDDSTGITSVYEVDFENTSMSIDPVFRIMKTEIEQLLGAPISKFKPSGAAVHPVTGDFYYISAINDIMIVTGKDGKVKEACAIDGKLFKQPEGIAFTPKGDMIISNESADIGTASLLFYKYNPQDSIHTNKN